MPRLKNTALSLLSISLGAVLACGDDPRDPPGGGPDAAPGPDAGPAPDASFDAAIPLPDAAMNAEGPIITVLSPTEPTAGDYSSAAIVTDDRFTARCRAATNTDTGDRVDASTVRISATNSAGQSYEAFAQPTSVADEFEANIVVSNFANNDLSIRCTASDNSPEARENSEAIDTFLDLGPRVEILAPLPGTSYANQTDVIFTVAEAPVAGDDGLAGVDVANVELFVSGNPVTGLVNNAGTFSGTIVFNDPDFNPELDGQQTLTVRAPNLRTTDAVIREESIVFNVDSEGPTISIATPTPGQLVSGIIAITANVADPTGIEDLSVVATVAGVNEVQMNLVQGDEYSGLFDTRELGPLIFPNIIVRARDTTGNQSSSGFLIALDNAPPIVSLDSPSLRETQVNNGALECSTQFDPLGDDSVSDGQSVAQLFEIRARAEDLSNIGTQTSGVIVPAANVDPSAVELFILDDEGEALIVDTDGDGVCDEINPLLVPTSVPGSSNEVALINLVEIPSTGASFFSNAADVTAPTFADTGNDQCVNGTDEDPPDSVCISTPLTRVIRSEVGDIPVIYGVPPAEGLQCLGNGVDALATNLSEGWACAALRGADNLGNENVSAPLRMCIDTDLDQSDGCPAIGPPNLAGAPNCTGTYDPVTDTVDTGTPCVVNLVFGANELRSID